MKQFRNLGYCSQMWRNRIQESLKEGGNTQKLSDGTEKLRSSLEVLETIFLKDNSYLCGEEMTFAGK